MSNKKRKAEDESMEALEKEKLKSKMAKYVGKAMGPVGSGGTGKLLGDAAEKLMGKPVKKSIGGKVVETSMPSRSGPSTMRGMGAATKGGKFKGVF
jgi:hypothetical protein